MGKSRLIIESVILQKGRKGNCKKKKKRKKRKKAKLRDPIL